MQAHEKRETELNAKHIKKHNCTSTRLYSLLLIHENILNTRHLTMSQALQDVVYKHPIIKAADIQNHSMSLFLFF